MHCANVAKVGNSAIRSADPENPYLEPNMKCVGSHVAEIWAIWPFAYLGGIWIMEPPFCGGRGVVGGRRWHHSNERCRLVSYIYRLYIVTCERCAICNCNHSAAICDRMSPTLKSTGVSRFGPKFPGVPLGVDPWRLGLQRANIPG